ncbi:uncharacterized protein NPIL_661821 [Nephila pilipes]|uniref:Uncharacterized protein n=1 Tax=Nephila pilipes TaxID=299642 RepID=A0A8X6QWY4_NEPPI|nr:uncharacterized protein NPIL_661821 [Nephila pilipes]
MIFLLFAGPGLTEETSFSRSADSLGFVLDEESEDDLPTHERLGDFRKRIWKRTRRKLSRRRSSSSYAGSSSDMDDILEDPEPFPLPFPLRPASSEPSLHVASLLVPSPKRSPLSEAAEAVLVQMSGKRMMVTSSNGHLKAYSYDGVSPNLPVPFRARFRQRPPEENTSMEVCDVEKHESVSPLISCKRTDKGRRVAVEAEGEDMQLRISILWLAASMAQLHSLILYTLGHEQLKEVCRVQAQAVRRQWTVGDLSCEVLRFCRNRRRNSPLQLFQQIVGRTPSQDSL